MICATALLLPFLCGYILRFVCLFVFFAISSDLLLFSVVSLNKEKERNRSNRNIIQYCIESMMLSTYRAATLVDGVGQNSDLEIRLGLEKADLAKRDVQLKREFKKIAKQKVLLADEWKKARLDRASLEEDRRRFDAVRRSPWFQSAMLPTSKTERVKLNVGGQVFETSKGVLSRDRDSLLHAIVSSSSPLELDSAGCFYIDRDWWLFRHILRFLRDGRLPQDRELLAQIYAEADFYNLVSLRRAIRETLDPAHVVERTSGLSEKKLRQIETSRSLGSPSVYFPTKSSVRDGGLYDATRTIRAQTSNNAYETIRQSLDDLSALERRRDSTVYPRSRRRGPPRDGRFDYYDDDERNLMYSYNGMHRKHYAKRNRDDRWWTSSTYRGNDYRDGLSRLRTGDIHWHPRGGDGQHFARRSRSALRTHGTWDTRPGFRRDGYPPARIPGRSQNRYSSYDY